MADTSFEGRLALVTGASRGLGRALCLALAERGANVIAVSRNKKDLEALDDEIRAVGKPATLVPLDLRKWDGIDDLGRVIFERWKKLDILVGNAGTLGPMTPLAHIKPDEWQNVMDVNITANYRLIRSMDALLRASDAGRAVFISSSLTQDVRAFWGAYATSKVALENIAFIYARETEKTNLKVNVVNPGAMATAMRKEAYPGEDQSTLATPEDVAPLILKILSPEFMETGKRFEIAELQD